MLGADQGQQMPFKSFAEPDFAPGTGNKTSHCLYKCSPETRDITSLETDVMFCRRVI